MLHTGCEIIRRTGEPDLVCHIFGIGEKDSYVAPADLDYGAWDYSRTGGVSSDAYMKAGNEFANRRMAPVFTQQARTNDARDAEAYGMQQEAAGMYRNAALGLGPSAAGAQMQQGLDAAAAQQMAMARSAGGSGLQRAAAQRDAMANASTMGAQNAAAAAQLRAQEQQAGMAGFAGGAGNLRSSNIAADASRMQAVGMNNQTQLGLAGLKQQQQGANDAMQQFMINQGQGISNAQMAANINAETTKGQNYNQAQGLNTQSAIEEKKSNDASWLGTIQAGASVAGVAMGKPPTSDRRLKEHIEPGDHGVDMALDGLRPYRFEYKRPEDGRGPQLGVMAQDLERSPLGSAVVDDEADGKKLNIGKAVSFSLAGLASLNKRLEKLEGKK